MITLCRRSIAISLFFILVVIPLLVNPLVFNSIELIKRQSAYVLTGLVCLCALALLNKKKTLFTCIPCP